MRTKKTNPWSLILLLGTSLGAAALGACSEDSTVKEQTPGDGGTSTGDAGPLDEAGQPTDCVQNPKTHEELINACTDAVKVDKSPTLPLLLPDGGLPPLP